MGELRARGVRGAVTVSQNNPDEIVHATQELLAELLRLNGIPIEDVASCIFSVTQDLDAAFPAVAARQLGWTYTPLLCTYEMKVPGSLPRCIRVLLHVNSDKAQSAMKHVYLREAKSLRPDLG